MAVRTFEFVVVVVVVVGSVAINTGLSNRKRDHRLFHFRYFRRSNIGLVHFDISSQPCVCLPVRLW